MLTTSLPKGNKGRRKGAPDAGSLGTSSAGSHGDYRVTIVYDAGEDGSVTKGGREGQGITGRSLQGPSTVCHACVWGPHEHAEGSEGRAMTAWKDVSEHTGNSHINLKL